ncbi:MAG: GDP-mannose 4,6-dehydratase [Candidatus Heimdallarchaeota archaeon]|nr:GDP-mannose 4,6-dehydratase [Candidatus Heimdallarchaeota archaeon]
MSNQDKTALITGITGQDGSYLAELLLNRGYNVHGIIRKASTFNTQRIDHLYQSPQEENKKLYLHYGDVTDFGRINSIITRVQPDEVYHLAAQSHVRVSFDLPEYTGLATGIGTTAILEAIRQNELDSKFYQASSSELYGSTPPPQNEETPMHPRSPYAVAKLYSYWMAINYRESYGMFASNGILFNHESPRRGEIFVTRKITRAVASILAGKQKYLYLGNIEAKRDWGYAPEYVDGMYKIISHSNPDDFVLSTGKSRSVREFLEQCFSYVGLNWKDYVKIDPKYFRPAEVDHLLGDSSKAEKLLNWKAKIDVDMLARIMIDSDMRAMKLTPIGEGIEFLKTSDYSWTKNKFTVG